MNDQHPDLNLEGMQKLSKAITNVINKHYIEIGLSPLEIISVLATTAIEICGNSSDPIRHLSVIIKTLDSQQSLDRIKKISINRGKLK
jgi:hypothetical protein